MAKRKRHKRKKNGPDGRGAANEAEASDAEVEQDAASAYPSLNQTTASESLAPDLNDEQQTVQHAVMSAFAAANLGDASQPSKHVQFSGLGMPPATDAQTGALLPPLPPSSPILEYPPQPIFHGNPQEMVLIPRYALFDISASNTLFHDRALSAEQANHDDSLAMLESVHPYEAKISELREQKEGNEKRILSHLRDTLAQRENSEKRILRGILELLVGRDTELSSNGDMRGQEERAGEVELGNAITELMRERVEEMQNEAVQDEQYEG